MKSGTKQGPPLRSKRGEPLNNNHMHMDDKMKAQMVEQAKAASSFIKLDATPNIVLAFQGGVGDGSKSSTDNLVTGDFKDNFRPSDETPKKGTFPTQNFHDCVDRMET
jgi:hypothetical protein